MKTLSILLLCVGMAHAQYIVHDPKQEAQNALRHMEDLAKQAEQIKNQVEQIRQLTDANDIANFTNRILGQYGINTNLDISKLQNTYQTFRNVGKVDSIEDVTKISRSMREIMGYGNGKYAQIAIDEERAKRYGQVQSTYEAYVKKSAEAKTKRASLAKDYEAAMQDAAEAKNQADRDMAVNRANAAKAALEEVDQEVNQAASDVQVQASLVASEHRKEVEAIAQKIINQQLDTAKQDLQRIRDNNSKQEIK